MTNNKCYKENNLHLLQYFYMYFYILIILPEMYFLYKL